MASSSPLDLIFWGDVLGGAGLLIYLFFLWLRMRGMYTPSPRMANFIRLTCLCLLLAPVAARYQYSQAAILYLSAVMCIVGLLVKLKQKTGI